MIIPKITDVYVTLDVTHPQTTVGLSNPALFVKGDTQGYKEYQTLDALEGDFDATTSTYAAAKAAFDQTPFPELVAIITYTGESTSAAAPKDPLSKPTADGANIKYNAATEAVPTAGIAKAAFDYFYNNWEFAILVDYNKADALALADVIENGGYDAKGYHINFLQLDEANKADVAEFAKFTRTFVFYNGTEDEYYAVALAAKGAQSTIGQTSWKFVSDLVDVTPLALATSDIQALENLGLICYVPKGTAHSNQTDDKNAAGMYIDIVHGMDFVKSTVENGLQNTLNVAGKTTYDAKGLATLGASLDNSLGLAYNQGVIATDPITNAKSYSYSMPSIVNVRTSDIAERILNNVTFDYTPSSAVNVINVHGNVNALA